MCFIEHVAKIMRTFQSTKGNGFFSLYYAHLIVPFAPRKVLAFDNKSEKYFFPLYCAHLIVPLPP